MSNRTKELLGVALLVAFALAVRLEFQAETITDNPLRGDASLYYSAAYNLHHYGAHSIDAPSTVPPTTRTDLAPGYPLFLSLFVADGPSWPVDFLRIVRNIQVAFGTLIVLFTYVIARQSLDRLWALVAALLSAISPHLIAIQEYILTESLFTFVMMLGVLVLLLAWTRERPWLALPGGILIAASGQIRSISLALAFILMPVLLVAPRPSVPSRRSSRLLGAGLALAGVLIVGGAHRLFVHEAVLNTEAVQTAPEQFVVFATPMDYLRAAMRPTNFMVAGASHIEAINRDPAWKFSTTASFREAPMAYLKWNLGGKLFYIWHFDNSYNGDVYIYPMTRTGFQENPVLGLLHGTMRALHWPLFGLAAAAPIVLLARARRRWNARDRSLLVPTLGFVYFIGVIAIVSWLPRYSIPARPFSYILAAATLSWAVAWAREHGRNWWEAQDAPGLGTGDRAGATEQPPG